MSQDPKELLKRFFLGDKRALARLMTFVDNRHEKLLEIMCEIQSRTGHALKIGVTGPPGAGKSTLVDKLISRFRSQNKTVGVVAIDPSSPFSGGAVLGDRIRMQDHNGDDGVFIRSLGSRGAHGGLSRATRDIVHLLDAFQFDVILIETVGVGQTELDIMSVADTTLVVLVPESGDTIQTMKAGLMEIADIFVVNKADREGADRILAELKSLSEMYSSEWSVPVEKTTATSSQGIDLVMQRISEHQTFLKSHPASLAKAGDLAVQECLDILLSELHQGILNKMQQDPKFSAIFSKLKSGASHPYQVALDVLKELRVFDCP